MKRTISLILALITSLTSLFLVSCAGAAGSTTKLTETEYIIASEKIIIGNTAADNATFDAKLIERVIKSLAEGKTKTVDDKSVPVEIKIEYVTVTAQEAAEKLKEKKVDVVLGLDGSADAPEGVKYTVNFAKDRCFALRDESELVKDINTAMKELYNDGRLNDIAKEFSLEEQLKAALGEKSE